MKSIKCVVVGDKGVGKTTLLISHTTNGFPLEYLPSVLDCSSAMMMVNGKKVDLILWDTAGVQGEHDQLRPGCYSGTDIFLVCFTINRRQSFYNARDKWVPEIKFHCPEAPFILVGTRIDIRDYANLPALPNQDLSADPVTSEEGEELARQLGAVKYSECSALTTVGQRTLFDDAVRAVLDPKFYFGYPKSPGTDKKKRCIIQ